MTTTNPAFADLTDAQLLTHIKGLQDRKATETHRDGTAHFTALINEAFLELGQRVAAQYAAERDALLAASARQKEEERVVEVLLAPQTSVRIVTAQPACLGYGLQYEYAREGRAKLYGGTQTQQWRTICWDGYGGKEGPRTYTTLGAARAAAKRVLRCNNP